MFHRYSAITGRLVQTEKIISKFPLTPLPLNRADPPPIVYGDSHVKIQRVTASNVQMKPGVIVREGQKQHVRDGVLYGEMPEWLKKRQEHFQKPDGIPVHLKGGPMDRALYYLTFALCGLSILMSGKLVYELAYPKKPE